MPSFNQLPDKEKEARLGLHQITGIGAGLANRLVAHFGSAVDVFSAGELALNQVEGIGAGLASRLAAGFDRGTSARLLAQIQAQDIQILCSDDPAYPQGFGRLRHPPYLLFCAGTWPPQQHPHKMVALVGTRRPDSRGIQLTQEATASLVQQGFAIVSGGALGIDTAAHITTLSRHGSTIAILAHGVDQAYPPQNRSLFQRIREQGGLLMSEFAPGTRPERGHFPRRNRLISGLCAGVVVVQCGATSGALNTAMYAKQMGIPVMTFPGRPQEALAAGPHQLLRQGAHLIESGKDIASLLQSQEAPASQLDLWSKEPRDKANATLQQSINSHVVTVDSHPPPLTVDDASLDPPSQVLLAQLDQTQPKHIDQLAVSASIPVAQATACLLLMELEGWVLAHPGMQFTRL